MPSVVPAVRQALAIAGLLALAGCGDKAPPPPPEATETGSAIASASGAAVESEFGTPIKDRVATLGFLNKRNNITQDIVLKSGESRRIGNAIVKLSTCEKTAPWEDPAEIGAFVQLFVEERATTSEPLAASSPSPRRMACSISSAVLMSVYTAVLACVMWSPSACGRVLQSLL